MTFWSFLQIVFDSLIFLAVVASWMRLKRPPQDDPRLSRGLQLLQTKITVLEDLSDRTDAQVKQLSGLLDQKTRFLQNKMLEAEQQVLKIDHSMTKSLEVAEIFQDKIPHQEILERQRTVEYVKAARMAHSGASIDEIITAVQLPREQVELIAKFNREQLMFDETQLPEWADKPGEAESSFSMQNIDFVNGLEPRKDLSGIAQIQQDFKQAVQQAKTAAENPPPTLMDNRVTDTLRSTVASGVEHVQPAVQSLKATAHTLREKLVNTAEEFLKSPKETEIPDPAAPPSVKKITEPKRFSLGSPVVQGGDVKKVVFPRIEK